MPRIELTFCVLRPAGVVGGSGCLTRLRRPPRCACARSFCLRPSSHPRRRLNARTRAWQTFRMCLSWRTSSQRTSAGTYVTPKSPVLASTASLQILLSIFRLSFFIKAFAGLRIELYTRCAAFHPSVISLFFDINCSHFITQAEDVGFCDLSLEYPPTYRNNQRVLVSSNVLAKRLYQRLECALFNFLFLALYFTFLLSNFSLRQSFCAPRLEFVHQQKCSFTCLEPIGLCIL